MGVTILGPDVRCSRISWTGRGKQIRVGLMAVKGLGRAVMDKIVMEREKGMFKDCFDFFERISPREDEARALTDSGSLDALLPGKNRAALAWAYCAHKAAQGAMSGPAGLFDLKTHEIPVLPPDCALQRLRRQFAVLGFLPACHPMTLVRAKLVKIKAVKAVGLPGMAGRSVCFAGWLIAGKLVKTRQGEVMKFLTFEDDTGLVETVFFPKIYARFSHILNKGYPYLLTGKVESEWGAVTLTVVKVCRI